MSELSTWSSPQESPSVDNGEVHVWRVRLEQPEYVLEKFRRTLNPEEMQRASRFHFERHRREFVASHGFLREVLSRYLHTKPESLRFAVGAYGKPALDGEHENSRLRFNMSHSHGVALLGVTLDQQLGVDVEYIRADFASADIACHYFSKAEVETFKSLAKEEQVAAFFRCWTRKEAFIKATGFGLSQGLDGFDVTLAPDVPAAVLRVDGDEEAAARWTMRGLDVGREHAGAVAVEGAINDLRCWQFS